MPILAALRTEPMPPKAAAANPLFATEVAMTDTPFAINSHQERYQTMSLDDLKKLLKNELAVAPPCKGDALQAFPHVTTQKRIDDFFEKTKFYKSRRWTGIPTTKRVKLERDLYEPLLKIITGIITFFRVQNRKARDTSKTYLPHSKDRAQKLDKGKGKMVNALKKLLELEEASQKTLKSAPDITITPTQSSKGCILQEKNRVSYASCVTPLEVKLNKNKAHEDHLLQIMVYARECLYEQRNRRFVWTAIITESTIQLFQFNRSRPIRCDPIDYHKNPEVFVRLILGLVSNDDRVAGFDTSITFLYKIRFIKVLTDPTKEIHRDVKINQSRWVTSSIFGRGTTCWSVTIGKDDYLVKDLWMGADREPEWKFLEAAAVAKVPGVARMLSHEEFGTALTDESIVEVFLREDDDDIPFDRVWCRVTLRLYGATLDYATSVEWLLLAFRDAVKGHWGLWKLHILHRDVSLHNVLLGLEDSQDGYCGVLIDLDHAIWTDRTKCSKSGPRTGTRAFQSVKVLLNGYPHSFWDDLNSFFFLLGWLCLSLIAPGDPRLERHTLLDQWCNDDPNSCANAKIAFMGHFEVFVKPQISKGLGKPIQTLLENLCRFLNANTSPSAAWHDPSQVEGKTVAELYPDADDAYTEFVGYIQTAIEAVQAEKKGKPVSKAMENVQVDPTSPSPAPGHLKATMHPKTVLAPIDLNQLAAHPIPGLSIQPVAGSSRFPGSLGTGMSTKRSTLHEDNEKRDGDSLASTKRIKLSTGEGSPVDVPDSPNSFEEYLKGEGATGQVSSQSLSPLDEQPGVVLPRRPSRRRQRVGN